jgi:hypothetical protein
MEKTAINKLQKLLMGIFIHVFLVIQFLTLNFYHLKIVTNIIHSYDLPEIRYSA